MIFLLGGCFVVSTDFFGKFSLGKAPVFNFFLPEGTAKLSHLSYHYISQLTGLLQCFMEFTKQDTICSSGSKLGVNIPLRVHEKVAEGL